MENFIPFESSFISFEASMESFRPKLENAIQKETAVFEMGATRTLLFLNWDLTSFEKGNLQV